MSISIDRLCSDFESALGCPYDSPGTTVWSGIGQGVDCSGLFAAALRNQGVSLPHGSNAIARGYTEGMARLTSAVQLTRGMAVFMWQQEGAPAKYTDGQGNYHHMGLVTSVKPLRIIHASSSAGQVVCGTSIRSWTHCARLRGADNDTDDSTDNMKEDIMTDNEQTGMQLQVTASPSLRVRGGPGTGYAQCGSLKTGSRVTADELRDGWYHLADGSGWICATYVKRLTQQTAAPDRLTLLEQRVTALEQLHREAADAEDA